MKCKKTTGNRSFGRPQQLCRESNRKAMAVENGLTLRGQKEMACCQNSYRVVGQQSTKLGRNSEPYFFQGL